jgi:hypothetical protein
VPAADLPAFADALLPAAAPSMLAALREARAR